MTKFQTPKVLDERATLRLILDGKRSLSRFGDGELKIMMQRGPAPGQEYSPGLAKRLKDVAKCEDRRLVVAVPRIYGEIPKHMRHNWGPWAKAERTPAIWWGRTLGSAFVSRPDFYGEPFGPWYWAAMRTIWQGRPALLVRGSDRRPQLFDNAASVEVLVGPRPNAWKAYGRILQSCLIWANKAPGGVVIAMLGPTATVLAHDLAMQGVQALDLGKAPRFYRDEAKAWLA